MTRKIPSDAFDCYVSMGEGRSYEKVASKYGVSKRASTDCAKREEWGERLENIEKESRQMSDKKLAEAMQEMRERHLRTIKAMNVRALEAMRQYPLATGMEAMKAAEMAIQVQKRRKTRVATAEVNRVLGALTARQQPPQGPRGEVKILYGTQASTAPPLFVLWLNRPKDLARHYVRYVENGFREAWDFLGTPVRFRLKKREERRR